MPAVLRLRQRQARNLMATLFLSQGVPMLLAGDEFLRTQGGNNNAWCQDNELSWFDWRLTETQCRLAALRARVDRAAQAPSLPAPAALLHRAPGTGRDRPDIAWHGERLHEPPWDDAGARLLAFTLAGQRAGDAALHVILNMSDAERTVAVPVLAGQRWRLAVDTAHDSPHDITRPGQQTSVDGGHYLAQARSVVVLEAGLSRAARARLRLRTA